MSSQQRRNSFVSASVTAVVSAALTLGVVSLGTSAKTQEAYGKKNYTCSNATLKGNYGVQATGFFGTQAPFTPISATRIAVFDGQGNFDGSGYVSAGGNIFPFGFSGTYEVNSDCTVTLAGNVTGDLAEQNNQFGVVVDGGKEIYTTRTDAGSSVNFIAKRVK
ncbi:MAG: hypothetical protein KME30_17830 [Iphinoe sp. HA4291-MV1]|nr:hypothetical protein [Iphinoe sp. HA4291-MV1]